jgi:hypothetical protein
MKRERGLTWNDAFLSDEPVYISALLIVCDLTLMRFV